MATTTKKDLSQWMSGYMDEIGFHRKRILERIIFSNKSSKAKDISNKNICKNDKIEKIFVGSCREGIGMAYCNDIDILQINHAVFCFDGRTISENDTLNFRMEQKSAPAGYTLLKLISKDTDCETYDRLKYALEDKKRGKYLSSKLFLTKHDDVFQFGDGVISKNTHYKSPKGPSIPKCVKKHWTTRYAMSLLNLKDNGMDFVQAFPCQADKILEAWKKRDRKCDWPNQMIIDNVMSMPVYVVPVGKMGSIDEDLQWRISFCMAETHLIQAFNNTQTKVLVLMKLITKHILHPICSGITSYEVKTVMLWQAENIPQRNFLKKNLLSQLMDALAFLETAIRRKSLPSYMIPDKNLFANKVTEEEQQLLLKKLEFIQVHGQQMVSDFFNNCLDVDDSIQELSDSLFYSNFFDKCQTDALHSYTTEELANYFIKMFTIRSWRHMWCYNFIFIWAPFFLKYDNKGLDPSSNVLPECLAENEKKGQTAIKQICEKTTSSVQTVEKIRIHQNSEEESKMGLFYMILMFIIGIIIVLLLLHSRVFLKLLLSLLFSNHMVIISDEELISDVAYLSGPSLIADE